MASKGFSGHHKAIGNSQVWLTPPEIIKSLGVFDLDPCSPINRPWDTAKKHYTEIDNGLLQQWEGRVWLNPPYDKRIIPEFLLKMANHANGTALIFARTDTQYFQNLVFPYAESMLFIEGRLSFYYDNGQKANSNGGAPSVLISYSEYDSYMIEQSGIKGAHIPINSFPVIVVEQSPSWRKVVEICLVRLNGTAQLKDIYKLATVVADDKVSKNKHYKEKIRQTLQQYFEKVDRGVYSKN